MTTIVDDDARRAALVRHFGYIGEATDVHSHDIYHPDAILEFPQSGERFEGVDNFRQWREQYPTPVAFHLRRITGSGDVWVGEASISYDGGPPVLGVSVHEFRGDLIARERIYVAEPWDAPEWRARWRAAKAAD